MFLVDAYDTWWNQGLVDEAIFGDEVLTEWPKIIQNVI